MAGIKHIFELCGTGLFGVMQNVYLVDLLRNCSGSEFFCHGVAAKTSGNNGCDKCFHYKVMVSVRMMP